MLPSSYFGRLTQCMGMRTDRRGGERRRADRIPATFRPEVFPVVGETIQRSALVRARDVSAGGIGLLLSREIATVRTVVVRVKPRVGEDEYVMLCARRRTVKIDGAGALGGFSIEKVLYPGQKVEAGQRISAMLWVDMSGEKVGEDPFLADGKAA